MEKTVLQRLIESRLEAGLSISEVAALTQMDEVRLSDIEDGKTPLTVDELLQICVAINYEPRYVLSGKVSAVFCEDCGLPYDKFPMDTYLPDDQWTQIIGSNAGGGMLCAGCIVKRGKSLIPDVIYAKLVFVVVSDFPD